MIRLPFHTLALGADPAHSAAGILPVAAAAPSRDRKRAAVSDKA